MCLGGSKALLRELTARSDWTSRTPRSTDMLQTKQALKALLWVNTSQVPTTWETLSHQYCSYCSRAFGGTWRKLFWRRAPVTSWFHTKNTVCTENKFHPPQSCNQQGHCQPSSVLPSAAPAHCCHQDITSAPSSEPSFSAPRSCMDQAEIKVAM